MYSVKIQDMIKEFNLKNLTEDISLEGRLIETAEVNRPALQLAGFFDYFECERVQIIGIVEYTYLSKLAPEFRQETLEKLFEHKMPCVVISRGLEPHPEMMFYARESGVPILQTQSSTSEFMGELLKWLRVQLAERTTIRLRRGSAYNG